MSAAQQLLLGMAPTHAVPVFPGSFRHSKQGAALGLQGAQHWGQMHGCEHEEISSGLPLSIQASASMSQTPGDSLTVMADVPAQMLVTAS